MADKKKPAGAKTCAPGLKFLGMYFIWRLREPTHGYALISELKQSPMLVALKAARIYAILDGLEESGLISSTNRMVDGRMRRVYSATQDGRVALERAKKAQIPPKMKKFVREMFFSNQ